MAAAPERRIGTRGVVRRGLDNVGSSGSGAAVVTAAGAGFVYDYLGEEGERGLEAVPDPACEDFGGRVFESRDFVEESVIELLAQRFAGGLELAVVEEVTAVGRGVAFDDDFGAEAVAVEAAALVSVGEGGQGVCGFEGELLDESDVHSDAPGLGRPDQLVKLDAEPDVEAVFEDPGGEVGELELAEDGIHEHLAACGQVVPGGDEARPIVIGAVCDDELDFVVGGEEIDVSPVVAMGLAAGGALEVHDADDARVDAVHEDCAGGFEHDGRMAIGEAVHEGVDGGLEEGLAAGDFDGGAVELRDLVKDIVEGHPAAVVEGVRGVAPGAAEVAAGEADEGAGETCAGSFALYGVKDFVDPEAVVGHEMSIVPGEGRRKCEANSGLVDGRGCNR